MSAPFDTSASVPPPGLPVPAPPTRALYTSAKSPTTAVVLTLAWPGAGHWYAGEQERGLAFAAATLLGAALSLVTAPAALIATIAFIWALVDVRHAVKRAAS